MGMKVPESGNAANAATENPRALVRTRCARPASETPEARNGQTLAASRLERKDPMQFTRFHGGAFAGLLLLAMVPMGWSAKAATFGPVSPTPTPGSVLVNESGTGIFTPPTGG